MRGLLFLWVMGNLSRPVRSFSCADFGISSTVSGIFSSLGSLRATDSSNHILISCPTPSCNVSRLFTSVNSRLWGSSNGGLVSVPPYVLGRLFAETQVRGPERFLFARKEVAVDCSRGEILTLYGSF